MPGITYRDVVDMPNVDAEPLIGSYSGYQLLEEFFGIGAYDFEREILEKAVADGDPEIQSLVLEHKGTVFFDFGGRTGSVRVLRLNGKPVAALFTAGRGERDFLHTMLFDRSLLDEADRIVRRFVLKRHHETDTLDLDAQAPAGFYDAGFARTADGLKLVLSSEIDGEGRLSFDAAVFSQRVRQDIEPGFPGAERGKVSLDDPAYRAAMLGVLEASVPEGRPTARVDRFDQFEWQHLWLALRFLDTAEPTYLVMHRYEGSFFPSGGLSKTVAVKRGLPTN